MRRGLSWARMKPTRSAPASTATSTSSWRVSPHTLTSGRAINSASFAPGSGASISVEPTSIAFAPASSAAAPWARVSIADSATTIAVPRHPREQLELAAAVELERGQVARVDADHRRPQRDRALELVGVVRLDERVDAERARLAHQPHAGHVVEVAQQKQRGVGARLGRGAQVLGRAEEALRDQRQRGRRARRAKVVPGAAEAVVDEHRHRPRAVLLVGARDRDHVPSGPQVAGRGRAPLELGNRSEPRCRERVGESH